MAPTFDLDHLAVAVERQSDAWPRYAGDLAGEWLGGGATPGFAAAQVKYANGMKVEVLEPHQPEQNNFLRRFLDRRGPGPHHLTFKTDDIEAALQRVEDAGYRPVGVDLRDPFWKEAFLHPKDAPGIVVQVAESAGEGDWWSPRPPSVPEPRTDTPATLVRIVHAVADLDDAAKLFVGLLEGQAIGEGKDASGRWVELAWPGPGRVRFVSPTDPSGSVAAWLGTEAGRLSHVEFHCQDPAALPDATPAIGGMYEIAPHDNGGVRLLLGEEGYAGVHGREI